MSFDSTLTGLKRTEYKLWKQPLEQYHAELASYPELFLTLFPRFDL